MALLAYTQLRISELMKYLLDHVKWGLGKKRFYMVDGDPI